MDILSEPHIYVGENVVVEVYASNPDTNEQVYRGPDIEDLEPAAYTMTSFNTFVSTVEAVLGHETLLKLNVRRDSQGHPLRLHLAESGARAVLEQALRMKR